MNVKKIAIISLMACVMLQAAGQHSNRRAPGFSLMDTHFDQHDLQDYLGKVVVIDFMQTGCILCNAMADSLTELKSRYGDKIEILSVLTQPDTLDTAAQFAQAHHATWPMLFDSGQVMMSYYQTKPTTGMDVHFPHLFLIDRLGVIRNDFDPVDLKSLTVGGLSAEIDKLLK